MKCLRSSGSVPCLPYPVSEVVDEGTRRRGGRGDPHARGSRAAGLRRARRHWGGDDEADAQRMRRHYLARYGATTSGDPVARFHLENGARLGMSSLAADVSDKGLAESLGVMVNYLYDLAAVEANHQRFMQGGGL